MKHGRLFLTWLVGLVVAATGAVVPRAGACSLRIKPPVELTANDVVFFGVVEELLEPAGWLRSGRKRWAARVRVAEPVWPPDFGEREVAVVGAGVGVDCSPQPWGERIFGYFPPGSRVRVAGILGTRIDGLVTVHISVGQIFSVNQGAGASDPGVEVSYRQVQRIALERYRRALEAGQSHQLQDLIDASFELRRDLARLLGAADNGRKVKILRRLAHQRSLSGDRETFERLLHRHLDDQAAIDDLLAYYDAEVEDYWAAISALHEAAEGGA